jgi:AraC-like DNA-binding protein/uncharacterized RmlC-like cupin family protein
VHFFHITLHFFRINATIEYTQRKAGIAVPEFITLDLFQATERHYYIYKIRNTILAHQDHYHNYYQLCYVVSGQVLHRQNSDTVTLSAGDVFIVPPGLTHSLHLSNAYSEVYSLAFEESLFAPGFRQSNAYKFLESLLSKATDPSYSSNRLCVPINRNQRRQIEQLLECLNQQQQNDCPPELSAAPSITAAIVYLLAQSYYQQPHNTSALDELASYNSTLQQCIAYIDQHFREPISLSALSKRFGLSRSTFYSIFPQFSGMPLHKYIAHKRIKEAQILMRSYPDRPIFLIAAEVGYTDDTTFYRNFLRITGISPSKYKSIHVCNDQANQHND